MAGDVSCRRAGADSNFIRLAKGSFRRHFQPSRVHTWAHVVVVSDCSEYLTCTCKAVLEYLRVLNEISYRGT